MQPTQIQQQPTNGDMMMMQKSLQPPPSLAGGQFQPNQFDQQAQPQSAFQPIQQRMPYQPQFDQQHLQQAPNMGAPSAFMPPPTASSAALQRPPSQNTNLNPLQPPPQLNNLIRPPSAQQQQPQQTPLYTPQQTQPNGSLMHPQAPQPNPAGLAQQMSNMSLNQQQNLMQPPPAASFGPPQTQPMARPPLSAQPQPPANSNMPNQGYMNGFPNQPPAQMNQGPPPMMNQMPPQMMNQDNSMMNQGPPAMNMPPSGPPSGPGQYNIPRPGLPSQYPANQPPPAYQPAGYPPQQPGIRPGYPNLASQQPGGYSQPPGPPGPPGPGGIRQPYPQTQPGAYPGQQMPPNQQMGYPNQPGYPPQQGMQQPYDAQQPQQPKMDLDQIPNPIEVMLHNNSKYSGEIFETNDAGKMPPLISTDFVCKDAGNCNPRFIRSSIYSVPSNADLMKQSKLPLVINLTPFAELRPEEREPPVSDLGELGPVRCKRCKAYMSPFMTFIDNGKKFTCPFCEDVTPVPQEYFNHLDHMGKRIDMYERAELCCGSYEFTATKDYCRLQTLPQPPAFIFMIDVSVNSVRSGLLHVLCPYIKNVILPNLPIDPAFKHMSTNGEPIESLIKVGFVTYDKELHFYNLKSSLAAPQMMIVSDIEEVFVPILDGFLVRLSESKSVIEALLDTLPNMFQENKETELVLGPVVEAGVEALKSAKLTGKLFIFHTNLPNTLAPGQLKNRDDKKLLGTDKEKMVLSPQNDYYAQLGKKCVENGCSVDLFLLPNQYCDIATLSDLSKKVNGQIYKYDFFMADTHGQRLCEDLKYAVEATVAFDAVMKVRTSTGIKPVDYLGNFNMYGNDVEMAGLQKQSSLAIELKHEDKLNENSRVYIQMALLYTTLSGQRRIRIHNLSLSVCTQYSQMFSSCDLDTLINYVAKLACRSITVSTPKSIRENLVQQIASILASYRKNCTNTPSKGQFILPETLKLLPVFSNSLLKSDVITGAQNITIDERAWLMHRLMSMDLPSTYALFYPRLLPLNDLETPDKLPTPIRCIYEKLKDDGIYLLENGLTMYLWIGANVDPSHVQNLFGVSGVQQLNVEKCKLLEIDTPISIYVRSVINMVNEQRKSNLKMLCSKSFELIKQLDANFSASHELIPYNEDNVRYTFEECRTLFTQNQVDVQPVLQGDNSNLPTIQMRHAALQRNKRCLLAYVYARMNWISSLRFELATVTLPKHIKSSMSDLEVVWFQKYAKTLANYMKSLSQATQRSSADSIYGIDLTQYTRPPKSLFIHVRCLQDYGEFELSDGHTVSLVKNSQHYLLASDVQDLIKQGTLEHID